MTIQKQQSQLNNHNNYKRYQSLMTLVLLLIISTLVYSATTVTLIGGGTTLPQIPQSYFTKIFSEANSANGGSVTYDKTIGTKRAIEKLLLREYKYAGVDFAPSAQQYETYPDLQMVPYMVAPIAVIFNLGTGGVNNATSSADSTMTLSLDGPTLAAIFKGEITMWNDAKIRTLNPLIELPSESIRRVVRQDKSGATYLFTSYLSAVDSTWNKTIGADTEPAWPHSDKSTLLLAETASGLSRKVFTTPYSISYAILKDAISDEHNLVALKNVYGKFVTPSIAGAASAVADFKDTSFDATFSKSLINGAGEETWPINGYSYFLYRSESMNDCKEAKLLWKYLTWLYKSSTVDAVLTENMFLALDDATRALAFDKVDHLKCSKEYVNEAYQKHLKTGGIAFGFFLLLLVIVAVITAIIYAIKFGLQKVFEKFF